MKTQGQTNGSKSGNKVLMWRKNIQALDPVEWSAVDPNILRGCVDACARAGAAIMLGRTSDGGAFSLCVLYQDQKIKDYAHTVAEVEDILKAITEEMLDDIL